MEETRNPTMKECFSAMGKVICKYPIQLGVIPAVIGLRIMGSKNRK